MRTRVDELIDEIIDKDARIAELEKYRDILESEVIQRTDRIAELKAENQRLRDELVSLGYGQKELRALLGGGENG